ERAGKVRTKMVNARKWLNSTFLKIEDITGPIEKTIIGVRESEKFDRPVLEFNDGTLLTVNQTNLRAVIRAYTEETTEWLDKLVKLLAGEAPYKGEMVPSIILEPISPKVEPKPTPKSKAKAKVSKPDIDDEVPFH